MTTITIIPNPRGLDEAEKALARIGYTLTATNAIEVPHTTEAEIKRALYALWRLAAAQVIWGFTIQAAFIRAV